MYPCMHSNVHYMYYAYNVQYKYIYFFICCCCCGYILLWVCIPLLQTGTTEAQLYLYVPKKYIYRRYEGTCVHEVYILIYMDTPIYNVYMTCTIRTSTLRIFCRQLNHYCFHTCVRVQSILT